MSFNYYSFDLYGKEYIFYTSRRLSENEVLEYEMCIRDRSIPSYLYIAY